MTKFAYCPGNCSLFGGKGIDGKLECRQGLSGEVDLPRLLRCVAVNRNGRFGGTRYSQRLCDEAVSRSSKEGCVLQKFPYTLRSATVSSRAFLCPRPTFSL